jgi:hypothetical protein
MTKISELPIEERRLYNRVVKTKSRAKAKAEAEAERIAKIIPKCSQYVMPESQRKKLDTNLERVMTLIQAELPQLSEQDLEIIDGMSAVVTGIENGYSQNVFEPEGVLIGGHFCDAMASSCIEHVHRYSQLLEESKTFSELYKKRFLPLVSKWCRKNMRQVAPEFMRDIEQELAGTYRLPEPQIKPPTLPVPDPPQPSIDMSGMKLSEQLHGDYSQYLTSRSESHMAPEARRYLSGETLNRNRF